MSDARLRRPRGSGPAARHPLARPPELAEATRWTFWLLTMISLLLCSLGAMSSSRGSLQAAAGASIVLLAASCTVGYLSRRAWWQLDLLDALLLLPLACASPTPAAALGFVFALIWFRCLYGSTGAALLRFVFYGATLTIAVLVWSALPDRPAPVEPALLLGFLPTMLVTVAAGRHLSGIVTDRDEAARRDVIHANASLQLLAVTEPATILEVAERASAEICAVTPGLFLVQLVDTGKELVVTGHVGDVEGVPTSLDRSLLTALGEARGSLTKRGAIPELDAAVGATCSWCCVPVLNDQRDAYVVLGSSRRVGEQVVDVVRSLVFQVTLAMRNSKAHKELTLQATLDHLTGLANRSLFHASLSTALAGAATGEVAVLFVDLDGFKDVNDLFGHGAGDELLREVAARLGRVTRADDLCARLGGDEFAVLIPGTDEAAVTAVGSRILDAIDQPIQLRNGVTRVGASVGVALGDRDTAPEQVVQRADIAMYAAKAAGSGRLQVFSPELLQGGALQAALDRQLLAATGNHEMVVHYQPVVSLQDGRCTAVEALVRWQHPERGLLPPSEFVAAAERTGAIRDIGTFVLRQACSDLTDWQRSGVPARLAVHVNVSALQLDEDFSASVLDCLETFPISPEQLVLEITETTVIASQTAILQLDRLAERGVVIAIDDFGTGYSALTSLRALPVCIVKIDKSFVAGCTVSSEDRAVTEAVVQMASRMGMRTIAEGIERPEQQDFLRSIGADAGQGYLYHRPATAAELRPWLQHNLDAAEAGRPSGLDQRGIVVELAPRRAVPS
ncbi:MAG TPA: EAL domain-containing protein [Nocardioidaceae bacterium]|nr:EAL domain-containing protein [Nocardioidaceae bacterium]